MNDAVQTNDDEEYDAAAEAMREEAEASGKDTSDKPPPHFLVENIKFLLQLSYSAVNAHAILQSPVCSSFLFFLSLFAPTLRGYAAHPPVRQHHPKLPHRFCALSSFSTNRSRLSSFTCCTPSKISENHSFS